MKSLSLGSSVKDLTFSFEEDEPEVIMACEDGVRLWDGNSQGPSRVIGAGSTVYSAVLLDRPEGKLIAGSCDGGIRVWRKDNGSVVRFLSSRGNIYARSISATRDGGQVVSGSFKGVIEVWAVGACDDQETVVRQSAYTEREPDDLLTHVAASEDRCKVVTVHNHRNMQIWSVKDGSCVQKVHSKSCIRHIAISANGSRIVTADSSGRIVFWNGMSGNIEKTCRIYNVSKRGLFRITSVALSRNALYLAVGTSDYTAVPARLERSRHFNLWTTRPTMLEAETECQYGGSKAAFDGLTAYAKEHGLESESYPVEQCGSDPVPGFSLSYSQSRFAFYVTRRSPACTNSTEVSSSMCSCTSKAMVDFYFSHDDEIRMHPYVSGLDIRQNRTELPLGMIMARKRSVNYLFLIMG